MRSKSPVKTQAEPLTQPPGTARSLQIRSRSTFLTKLRFDQRFLNGTRADMTATTIQGQGPQGTFTVAGTEPWAETSGATFDGIAFNSTDLPLLKNPDDVELTQRRTWALPIVCLRDVQAAGNKTMALDQNFDRIFDEG